MNSDLHDLLVPYALDALDPHERSKFESHLDQCDVCSVELNGFALTAVRMAEATEEEPPSALRVAVLDRVATTPQERPVVTAIAQHGALRRSLPRLAVAASVLVATAGLGGFFLERDRAEDLQAQTEQISTILTAEDSALLAAPATTGGELRIMHSPSHGDAVVMGSDLEPLADGRIYQVWAMYGDEPQPAGVLPSSSSMVLASGVGDADAFAVTIEPAGGSQAPTTEPIVDTRS